MDTIGQRNYDVYSEDFSYTPMRTNIVIDDKLMSESLRLSGAKTKREVVDLALRTLVRLGKQSQLRNLRGNVQWQGDLDRLRRDK